MVETSIAPWLECILHISERYLVEGVGRNLITRRVHAGKRTSQVKSKRVVMKCALQRMLTLMTMACLLCRRTRSPKIAQCAPTIARRRPMETAVSAGQATLVRKVSAHH